MAKGHKSRKVEKSEKGMVRAREEQKKFEHRAAVGIERGADVTARHHARVMKVASELLYALDVMGENYGLKISSAARKGLEADIRNNSLMVIEHPGMSDLGRSVSGSIKGTFHEEGSSPIIDLFDLDLMDQKYATEMGNVELGKQRVNMIIAHELLHEAFRHSPNEKRKRELLEKQFENKITPGGSAELQRLQALTEPLTESWAIELAPIMGYADAAIRAHEAVTGYRAGVGVIKPQLEAIKNHSKQYQKFLDAEEKQLEVDLKQIAPAFFDAKEKEHKLFYDKDKAMNEISRVLKTGKTALIAHFCNVFTKTQVIQKLDHLTKDFSVLSRKLVGNADEELSLAYLIRKR